MSTAEFDKFDLEGLSLEEMEPVKEKKLDIKPEPVEQEPVIEVKPAPAPEEQVVEAAPPPTTDAAEKAQSEDQMTCPKCELEQPKSEQCAGCGVYIAKALAQLGQSKIQITSTKF